MLGIFRGSDRLLSINKLRDVGSGGQDDAIAMVSALGAVIVVQALPEAMCLNTDDRVSLLVEICSSSEGLNGDRILFHGIAFSAEVLFTDERQKAIEIRRAIKNTRCEDRSQFGALALETTRRS
jgi:hypothetical protein